MVGIFAFLKLLFSVFLNNPLKINRCFMANTFERCILVSTIEHYISN